MNKILNKIWFNLSQKYTGQTQPASAISSDSIAPVAVYKREQYGLTWAKDVRDANRGTYETQINKLVQNYSREEAQRIIAVLNCIYMTYTKITEETREIIGVLGGQGEEFSPIIGRWTFRDYINQFRPPSSASAARACSSLLSARRCFQLPPRYDCPEVLNSLRRGRPERCQRSRRVAAVGGRSLR